MFPPWITVLTVLALGPWSPGPGLAMRRADEVLAMLTAATAMAQPQMVASATPEPLTVPPMSLFIPPAKLVSLLHGAKEALAQANSTDRPQLALEPLLAVLGPEEMDVLASFFPALFPTPAPTSAPAFLRDGDNETAAAHDPVLQWLLFGPNATTPPPPPTTRPPFMALDDGMIVSMLQQIMARATTTTTTTAKPRIPGPVGIGEEFLATLLESIHKQQQQEQQLKQLQLPSPFNFSSVLAVVTELPGPALTTATPPAGVPLTKTSSSAGPSKPLWPNKVKPGGGITDEALMAIIRDVEEINRNISALAGIVTNQISSAPAQPLSTDAVSQILKDVQNLQNQTDGEWLLNSLNSNLTSDSFNQLEDDTPTTKDPRKGKRTRPTKASKGATGTKGIRNSPNRLRKFTTRRPTRTRTTKRPSVWERIVKAAANAFFGTPKPRPGLFQVEDILDLLGSV